MNFLMRLSLQGGILCKSFARSAAFIREQHSIEEMYVISAVKRMIFALFMSCNKYSKTHLLFAENDHPVLQEYVHSFVLDTV